MITEDYISFETARLLKEKGFNEPCIGFYNPITGFLHESCVRRSWDYNRHGSINAPTHQMAMAWLREVHNWHICIDRRYDGYIIRIETLPTGVVKIITEEIKGENTGYKTYEEAVEAALKYCLENLV